VEKGAQRKAKDWTKEDMQRLRSLVDHAHALGLWIRFYTLNGYETAESQGWDEDYNFGSKERVSLRWRAALEAGVDFVATDQYEAFASMKAAKP
jgi:glycerophosphoryl diester phosphodiesterase